MEKTSKLKNFRETLRHALKERPAEAPEGFIETVIAGAVGCGVIGAVCAGYAFKRLGIPGLLTWAGSQLAVAQSAGTALSAAGSFLGLSAAGWVGSIAGLATGAVINAIPLMHRKIPAKTEYVLQHKILTLDMEEKVETLANGKISISPEDFPKLAVRTEHETRQTTARIHDLAEGIGALGGGLAGIFAGAALGGMAAAVQKCIQAVSKPRNSRQP